MQQRMQRIAGALRWLARDYLVVKMVLSVPPVRGAVVISLPGVISRIVINSTFRDAQAVLMHKLQKVLCSRWKIRRHRRGGGATCVPEPDRYHSVGVAT